ncbi:secretin N-terminal domain-containing protein [Caulobacter sp. BK020]|uniref:secretin N-terminal domain-containing protein n=1 Tax=Caulobacter sp. BK020 TaxID=2512117 RepID=UPI001042AC12|nr:secretin N-terminal domain-containing protein [Caulobacter sp. BK020]
MSFTTTGKAARRLGVAAVSALLASCASYGSMRTVLQGDAARQAAEGGGTPVAAPRGLTLPLSTEAAAGAAPAAGAVTDEALASLVSPGTINVSLPPQPLPQLINTAFGDLLGLPFVMAPEVASRTDIVTLRGAPGMTRRDFFRLTESALKTYGVRLDLRQGVVNALPVVGTGSPAVALRARSMPETPESARPVTQFVPVRSIAVDALTTLTQAVLPEARRVQFTTDPAANTVTLNGGARDVAAVQETLRQLDQPRFAGVGVFRVEPVYWSAESLARSLSDSLEGEGFAAGAEAPGAPRSMLVAPFGGANTVLVFARDPAVLERARVWAAKLDQPTAVGDRPSTFIYQVRNTDAQSLAAMVGTSGAGPVAPLNPSPPGAPGASPALTSALNNAGPPGAALLAGSGGGAAFMNGRIIVDQGGNRILFTGQADEFTQLRGLLASLDTPAREVLVEVTIAEVTLTDETRLGLEWFFTHSGSNGTTSGGTLGNLGLSTGGLSLTFNGTDVRAAFNAFASNNKVNILSRPRLVARSGGEARIQVGTDVPIITSRANSSTQTGGSTDILQTIQYRQTGVILQIRPIVYGDDRVDLEISQEVSSQQANPNAAIGSPLILNRNITTQLSLAEGATAVLGGLIDDSYTKGNTGVPFLKDIPVLGSAFRADTLNGGKTELVMLVTPYILRDSDEMNRWAGRYGGEMDAAFRVGRGWSYTLTPFKAGLDLSKARPDLGR